MTFREAAEISPSKAGLAATQFLQPISCFRRKLRGDFTKRPLPEILEEAAQSIVAMANAGGGSVIIGASSEEEARGIFFDERTGQVFLRKLANFLAPPLDLKISFLEAEGRKFLSLSVEASPEIICLKTGKAFLRIGPRNVYLSREKIRWLKETRAETWHEREILTQSSLADLDESLVSQFLKGISSSLETEKILYRPYGLIAYTHGQALLTRAAVYLFAKDPLRWHPRPGIEFIRLEGTSRERGEKYNVKERIRLEGSILKIINGLDEFISAHIQERIIPRDLFFKEKFVYPISALKEALINALAHRDYSLEGKAIEVYMYDDRLEIISPGVLPGFLKIDHLGHRERIHYARNPLIVRVLTDLGVMNSLGAGLPAIFSQMEENGLNPPEIRQKGNSLILILKNAPVMDKSTLSWLKNFSRHILNSRQIRILAYGRAHGMIFSSADYQKLGVDRDTAYTEIKELIQRGIVQPLKKHGKIYQIIEPAGGKPTCPVLEWVSEDLLRKEFFTIQDLKLPETISRKRALAIIKSLAKEGYFHLSGRGKEVKIHPAKKIKLLGHGEDGS